MGGLDKYLRGSGLGKKDGAVVLIGSFGGETGTGLFPLDDLGMDGFQTIVLQAFGGRTGKGQTTQPETSESDEGSRSHDPILNPPDFHIAWSMPPSTWRLAPVM